MFNDFFMMQALIEARQAYDKGEIPVGAIIIENSNKIIIARAHNLVESQNNASLHAEIIAINRACTILSSKYLTNCSIYTTLEPCTMCAAAIAHVKLHSLYYAATDIKQGAIEHGIRFFTSSSCFHTPHIYPGLKSEHAHNLITKFFKEKVR